MKGVLVLFYLDPLINYWHLPHQRRPPTWAVSFHRLAYSRQLPFLLAPLPDWYWIQLALLPDLRLIPLTLLPDWRWSLSV